MTKRIPTQTDPVRQLIDEHEIFMEALDRLTAAFYGVDTATDKLPSEVLETAREVWNEINEHLNVHFVKEEEIFFPFIERMIPGARIKFQFLHVDHDKLRESFEEYTLALFDYQGGRSTTATIPTLVRTTGEMVKLFYHHIVAEDAVYLDIAGELMQPDEAEEVLGRMTALEDRLRERIASIPHVRK